MLAAVVSWPFFNGIKLEHERGWHLYGGHVPLPTACRTSSLDHIIKEMKQNASARYVWYGACCACIINGVSASFVVFAAYLFIIGALG